MIPRDKLTQLQHKCKGQNKKNLYHLIGVQGAPPDHEELRKRLARKRDSWGNLADKAAYLDIVEQALELLETPAHKAEYDQFLREEADPPAPPVTPQQGGHQQPPMDPPQYQQFPNQPPWGNEQPPMTPPQYQQVPQPKRVAGLTIDALLLLAGLALLALSSLMTGTVPWNAVSPEPAADPTSSEAAAEGEVPTAPAEARAINRERTPPSDSPSSDITPPTTTDRGRPPTPPRRETPPPAAVASVAEPAPDPPALGPPGSPEAGAATGPGAPSARPVRAQAATTAAPAPEPVAPAPPPPPPVVEPVRVGGNVPTPRKTWNAQPEYPRLARLRRIQGTVILEVTVDREGNVSNVSVLRSPEGLEEAAVEAVRRWRYEPTIVNGGPVSVVLTETVRFHMEN